MNVVKFKRYVHMSNDLKILNEVIAGSRSQSLSTSTPMFSPSSNGQGGDGSHGNHDIAAFLLGVGVT